MAYKCECLFVCVILHLQPLHTDLDPSWTSSSDPITPSLRLKYLSPRSISPSYSTPCSSQSAMLYCTMCRQNLQYKCKESHKVWIVCAVEFKSRNSNWRGSIAFLCMRFYCDVVVLHFKSHCVYNRRGSNLFLMIFPWKSGSRILIYILHAVVWMPTDRERGNLFIERRDINLGLLQCALPPKAGWQMPTRS